MKLGYAFTHLGSVFFLEIIFLVLSEFMIGLEPASITKYGTSILLISLTLKILQLLALVVLTYINVILWAVLVILPGIWISSYTIFKLWKVVFLDTAVWWSSDLTANAGIFTIIFVGGLFCLLLADIYGMILTSREDQALSKYYNTIVESNGELVRGNKQSLYLDPKDVTVSMEASQKLRKRARLIRYLIIFISATVAPFLGWIVAISGVVVATYLAIIRFNIKFIVLCKQHILKYRFRLYAKGSFWTGLT